MSVVRRRRSPILAVLTLAGLVFAGLTPAGRADPAAATAGWTVRPLCGTARSGHMSCHGLRLVHRRAVAAAAKVRRPASGGGPAGGDSPSPIAAGYGLRTNSAAAAHQTVALVDAYSDPTVRADLNAFNRHYHLPQETGESFRVVNQEGERAPLPDPDEGWAGEIGLDVQAVRGICHKCRILLVEADSDSDADLAAAVNRAARMGADEISNSYGGTENDPGNTAHVVAAYNHPGTVITASTGDAGWYDWDYANEGYPLSNTPEIPAAYNTVVGVGGTSLYLDSSGRRLGERVWNNDGPADQNGGADHRAFGASGSGCSTVYRAHAWQSRVAGSPGLNCHGRRSSVDIAAVADPDTGYDVYQSYPFASGSWQTVGGTSLSAPLIAAMWALAGGPAGVRYPAMSLYGHFTGDRTRPAHDVVLGGTGLCGGAAISTCTAAWGPNPNQSLGGLADCAFRATGATVLAARYQCYARVGYDGVSGVGTPRGVGIFKPDAPTALFTRPDRVRAHVRYRYSAARSHDPFPGGHIVRYVWHWGDGHVSHSVHASATHRYASPGRRTVTLKVIDNYGRSDLGRRPFLVRR